MDLHEATRKIYEKQHERISKDSAALQRIGALYKTNTFGLPAEWFRGKTTLDAGCGNVGALIMRFAALGVARICGVDIGEDWIPLLRDSLRQNGVSGVQVELKAGSVLNIPYDSSYFDFVAINGVLIHLRDLDEVQRGFAEGARVCKPGGHYFTSYGPCGGLVQGAIFPAIRKFYRENADFKALIDNISPVVIHGAIDKICEDAKHHAGQDLDARFLKGLFGEDYCVFLQNYIQAPSWLSNECTPQFVEKLYKDHGFDDVVRLHSYAKRTDIRKYFAPLHYDREYTLSKALYGEGYVQYIGRHR